MEIKDVELSPYEGTIFPGIVFRVKIGYCPKDETILVIDGWLKTDDKEIVADLKEDVPSSNIKYYGEVIAKLSKLDDQFKKGTYEATLIAPLSRRALEYIEERRGKNKKGDVKLILNLRVRVLESMTCISHIHEVKPEELGLKPIEIEREDGTKISAKLLVFAYDRKYSSSQDNRWILSGDKGPVFIKVAQKVLRKEVIIPSSDWIYDYAPKLGLGEYFIVEIPKGRETIEKAWNRIRKAEECFRNWDMKGVFSYCREAGEVLNKAMREEFGKDSFTFNERWGRTYLRFFNYVTSLGLHVEDMYGKERWEDLVKGLPKGFPRPKRHADYPKGQVRISKSDAEHVLFLTKLLAKYAEELVEEKRSS